MNQRWDKLGQLYDPRSRDRHPKLYSHAANPLPILIEGDLYRVFFSSRDRANRSSVGAVDIDIAKQRVIREYDLPVFEHGPPGSFFADGISIGSCYVANEICYMLFMGWQAPKDSHWRGDIGRFIVRPNLSLELEQDTPFMGINPTDPISLSYPWVTRVGENQYFMWYGSTSSWDAGNGEMIHTIQFASSSDGHTWVRHGLAVPFQVGVAQAFSRPTVAMNRQGGFDMWFSYRSGRGESYRIGYATSTDGKDWRLDLSSAGISVSNDGWDSEMIEYPFVFDHKGQRYMLYNGNGFGKTGFGLATLVSL